MGDYNTCTAGLDKDIKSFIDKEKYLSRDSE
jgi:hypothetical protein